MEQPYYPAKYEEELLRLIIRYGERKLLIYRHEEGAEKQTPSEVALAYYIKSDLNADFQNLAKPALAVKFNLKFGARFR